MLLIYIYFADETKHCLTLFIIAVKTIFLPHLLTKEIIQLLIIAEVARLGKNGTKNIICLIIADLSKILLNDGY